MFIQPILPLGAKTVSGESQSVPVNDYVSATVFLDITAVSGTIPTLDVAVEYSPDNIRWFIHTAFSQKTTVGKATIAISGLGLYTRVKYTIAGTTPSFTFQVDIGYDR